MSVSIATTEDIQKLVAPILSKLAAVEKELQTVRTALDDGADHLTVKQAAKRLNVSENTIRTWVKTGQIESIRKGRKIMIPRNATR